MVVVIFIHFDVLLNVFRVSFCHISFMYLTSVILMVVVIFIHFDVLLNVFRVSFCHISLHLFMLSFIFITSCRYMHMELQTCRCMRLHSTSVYSTLIIV